MPVISIGNLTTGGTGKTPVVAYLAQWFRDRGVRVAIISRGYGRGDADENDEAAELHQRLPDVPHLQDPDRVMSAGIAAEELESQVILMDDGFQHRRLYRDLDIVLVDATCPFGFGYLLPRGLLREPIGALRRANAILLTRTDLVEPSELEKITARIRSVLPTQSSVPILHCRHRPTTLLQHPHAKHPLTELSGKRVALVSGIGNPDAFRKTVEAEGLSVASHRILADHAAMDREVIEETTAWLAEQSGLEAVLCTQKDLVKIQTDRLAGLPLYALQIEAEIDHAEELDRLLKPIVAD